MEESEIVAAVRERASDPKTFTDSGFSNGELYGPPVTDEQWSRTEREIACTLPPFLFRLYSEIGNGGFGPGYGLRGAFGGIPDDDNSTLAEDYKIRCEPDPDCPTWKWPDGYVALNDWG